MSDINTSTGTSSGNVHLTYVYRKGGRVLLHAGHEYVLKRKHNSGLVIWECANRKKELCRGQVKIRDLNIVEEKSHKCPPDFAKNILEEKIQECKDKIVSPHFPSVPKTFNAMISQFKDVGMDLVTNLPAFQSIKSNLYRHRNKTAGMDKIQCRSVEELQVPPKYEQFLLADYHYNGNRILVFCLKQAKQYLCEARDFLCDGTFKSCPKPFTQLYSIHGDVHSTGNNTNIIPLIYAYMTSRDFKSYSILFQLIKSQIPEWEPRKFTIDFEKAAMKAIRSTFPSAKLKGCYTHFKKAIWSKGRLLKLTTSKDVHKIREVALTAVLPLLPESEIKNGWLYITRRSTTDPDVLKFRKYMEVNWLKDELLTVWCIFGERHRTTNAVEGWHHRINSAVGTNKPNILQSLNVIQEDAFFSLLRNKQLSQNIVKTNNRKKKFILNDQYIKETQMELVSGLITVGQFLEMMRH